MPALYVVGNVVRVTAPGQEEDIINVVSVAQGVTTDGLIVEPDDPSAVSWQYIVNDLAYSEEYLTFSE